ncbi:hypothetical protein ACFQDN_23355 [Pseudomonas asuensis]|uniref:Uncharacterized protein n=1 Tax=Pseudomonas asuensis TaxID=1825787 RepID=A0ABQ2H506_9PSED|nr:hypothetical protein [Pseudomonas asuensis]GGM32914.1 hypothetical protein GCM10009425_49240 [Pseudomonas asuensis]
MQFIIAPVGDFGVNNLGAFLVSAALTDGKLRPQILIELLIFKFAAIVAFCNAFRTEVDAYLAPSKT